MRVGQICITKDGDRYSNARIFSIEEEDITICTDCFNLVQIPKEHFGIYFSLLEDVAYEPTYTVQEFLTQIQGNMENVQERLNKGDTLDERIQRV